MSAFLAELDGEGAPRHTIRKTRFGEIAQGMRLGGAYAFDSESYSRFLPLAKDVGLPVLDADFEAAKKRGERFLTIEVINS
jgi:hypothetical protein